MEKSLNTVVISWWLDNLPYTGKNKRSSLKAAPFLFL